MKEKENHQEDFSLYTEKIVVKPAVKYRRVIHFCKLVGAALMFGLVASSVMAVVYPWMSEKLNASAQQREALTIEKDEYPETGLDGTSESEEETESDSSAQPEHFAAGTLKAVVQSAQQSIVTIDCYRSSVDEVLTEGKSTTETVGIVIGEVRSEYIILTNYGAITDSMSIVVKFSDFTEVNAALLGYEEQTGLALLRVAQSEIPVNERNKIVAAGLDNSYKIRQGDMIVAAGKIYGQLKAVDYGIVTKITSMSGLDSNYEMMETGFNFQSGDYGYLFNMAGNLIGITVPSPMDTPEFSIADSVESSAGSSTFMLRAAGISDLKSMIERLSNGRSLPYMGIKGQNVTNAIAFAYGLPMGIYITEIEMDSPAFAAGLQQGDVIIGFDGNMVLTIQEFSEKLYQCSTGQNVTLTVKRPGKDNYREVEFTVSVSTR